MEPVVDLELGSHPARSIKAWLSPREAFKIRIRKMFSQALLRRTILISQILTALVAPSIAGHNDTGGSDQMAGASLVIKRDDSQIRRGERLKERQVGTCVCSRRS